MYYDEREGRENKQGISNHELKDAVQKGYDHVTDIERIVRLSSCNAGTALKHHRFQNLLHFQSLSLTETLTDWMCRHQEAA